MMKTNIKYSFRIIVDENGRMTPSFSLWPPSIGKYVNCLSGKTNEDLIIQTIAEIKSVLSREKEFVWVTDGGDCEFKVTEGETVLEGYYEDFESINLPTNIFLELFEKWLVFIQKYNNGLIPGIIPLHKREEWIIVPRKDVKKTFLDSRRDQEE